jgi:putative membrane protein
MREHRVLVCRLFLGAALAFLPVAGLAQSGNTSSATSSQNSGGDGGKTMGKTSDTSQNSSGLSAKDKKFINEAAAGGLAEVQLGQLATQKASSDEVKKFGQRMVEDHSKANDQLKQLASSKGINVPQDLSPKDQATKERLSKLSGDSFDKAYMADMVKDHKKDVADFTHASTSASDNDVKQFASQTLPTLQQHLQQAQSIAPTTKSSSMSKDTTNTSR